MLSAHNINFLKNGHTKKLFYDELIYMSLSISIPIFMKIRDKKFFESKNTQGVSLQVFLGPPKKKHIYFTKVVDDDKLME